MSENKEESGGQETPFPNPLKMFGEIYQQTLKQTAEQWEETARNPLFLAAMANSVEQSMQMQKQMQEMIATSLQALNLPTKDDFRMLVEKVDLLNSNLAEMSARLDQITRENKSAKAKKSSKGGKTKS